MRRRMMILAAVLTVATALPAGKANAQIGGTGVSADPFSFYYGFYLPHAAAMAATPTPLDTINQVQAMRTRAVQADRTSLYDPISPYGKDDDLDDYAPRRGGERKGRVQPMMTGPNGNINSNARGNGPASYYNRSAQYFPTLRAGRGPNLNISMHRNSRGMGGGMGGGMGTPGPR